MDYWLIPVWIIQTVFFLIIALYAVLLLIPRKRKILDIRGKSITVIMPARNEERYIRESLRSVINADWPGRKEVIVVDDCSTDATALIAKSFNITYLRNRIHKGKSASLNKAIALSNADFIAVVDSDSIMHKDGLVKCAREFGDSRVAAVSAIVRVNNRNRGIGPWVHIEQIYASLERYLKSKIHANITTPGPLSVYSRKALEDVGNFSVKGYAEDADITIKLLRKNYKAIVAPDAFADTNMPVSLSGFAKQHVRFARGGIHILKVHFFKKTEARHKILDYFAMPMIVFSYFQSVIMFLFNAREIIKGYFVYFVSKGVLFDFGVLKYFFEWFSIVGFVRWTYNIFAGAVPADYITVIGVASTLISYTLYIYAIARFDRRLDFWHLLAFMFMFPYWLIISLIYAVFSSEIFFDIRLNRWEKLH